MKLIIVTAVPADSPVIDVGGGTAPLAHELLSAGFTDVTVADISGTALRELKDSLPPEQRGAVHVLRADIRSEGWASRQYGLWHDRATFHFLTEAADQERYVGTLRSHLRPGGFVVVGTFAEDGPDACSELPVQRYSPEALLARLGPGFEPVKTLRHVHHTPSGKEQPFSWVVARRTVTE